MGDNEKISVAALISVILRRKIGRTIDVQWLIKDATYAREIITLSRSQGLDDLTGYANKLESLIFENSAIKAFNKPAVVELSKVATEAKTLLGEDIEEEIDENKIDLTKYIGHLR